MKGQELTLKIGGSVIAKTQSNSLSFSRTFDTVEQFEDVTDDGWAKVIPTNDVSWSMDNSGMVHAGDNIYDTIESSSASAIRIEFGNVTILGTAMVDSLEISANVGSTVKANFQLVGNDAPSITISST